MDSISSAYFEKADDKKAPMELRSVALEGTNAMTREILKRLNIEDNVTGGFYNPQELTLPEFDEYIQEGENKVNHLKSTGIPKMTKKWASALERMKHHRQGRVDGSGDPGIGETLKTSPEETERIQAFARKQIQAGDYPKDDHTGEPIVQIYFQQFPWPDELKNIKPTPELIEKHSETPATHTPAALLKQGINKANIHSVQNAQENQNFLRI